MLELLKLIVQPVILERDEEGEIVGEKLGEPTAMYSLADVEKFYAALIDQIAQVNGGSNGKVTQGHGVQSGAEPDRGARGDQQRPGGRDPRVPDAQGIPRGKAS